MRFRGDDLSKSHLHKQTGTIKYTSLMINSKQEINLNFAQCKNIFTTTATLLFILAINKKHSEFYFHPPPIHVKLKPFSSEIL